MATALQSVGVMMYFLEDWAESEPTGQEIKVAGLWSQLPEELMEKVLSYFPAATQARCQVLSKKWRSLLISPSFRQESSSSLINACRHGTMCIVMLHHPDSRNYRDIRVFSHNPFLKYRLDMPHVRVDLSFLPEKYRTSLLTACNGFAGGDAVSACWLVTLVSVEEVDQEQEDMSFCVVNLANMSWTELPPLRTPQISLRSLDLPTQQANACRASRFVTSRMCERVKNVGMAVDDKAAVTSFQLWVLATQSVLVSACFFRYSSKDGAWASFELDPDEYDSCLTDPDLVEYSSIIPVSCLLFKDMDVACVLYRVLYLERWSYDFDGFLTRALFFSVADGKCIWLGSWFDPGAGAREHLFEHSGRCWWIRCSVSPKGRLLVGIWATEGICLSKLESGMELKCHQISIMPQGWLPWKFRGKEVKCDTKFLLRPQLATDVIFMMISVQIIQGKKQSRMVAYHILQNSWQQFPDDTLLTTNAAGHQVSGYDSCLVELRPGLYV